MSALLYAFTCLCVVWLAIWSTLPKPYTKPTWWPYTWFPFDMPEDNGAPPPAVPARPGLAAEPAPRSGPFTRDWSTRAARQVSAKAETPSPAAPAPAPRANWRSRADDGRRKPSGRA